MLKSAPPSRAESNQVASAVNSALLKSAPPSRAESKKVVPAKTEYSKLKSAPPSRAESVHIVEITAIKLA